jgi:hypothetical protein
VSHELGGESNRPKTAKRAWPQKNETQEHCPGAKSESGFCICPVKLTSGSRESNTEVYSGSSGHAFWPKSNTPCGARVCAACCRGCACSYTRMHVSAPCD